MGPAIADSVTVITGASSGIGRATALTLAAKGGTVVLASRRKAALERLALECEDVGGHALPAALDVTDEDAVQALARDAVETFGRVDAWVNNAAVTLFGRFEETPAAEFRRVIDTNLFGYVHGARAILPWFREQGSGVLVNVSSIVGKTGQPFASAYVISKFGIVGLSECLRQELHDAPGIRVVTILPASIDTPLFQHGGNYMGRAARPMTPVYDPFRVADAIVNAIRAPDRQSFVGASGTAALLAKQLAPKVFERWAAEVTSQKHFQDRVVGPSPGNLFEPSSEPPSVGGGWQTPRRRIPAPWLAISALAGVAAGMSLMGRKRRL